MKGGETDMVFTYVPDAAKQLQDRKKDEQQMDETPFETMQRKLAEKKKARKAAKKLIKSGQGVDTSADKADVEAAGKGSGKKGKVQEVERAAATKAELELLLSDDDEGYDMRALHKQEQEAIKGPKAKRKGYVLSALCCVFQSLCCPVFTMTALIAFHLSSTSLSPLNVAAVRNLRKLRTLHC